MWLVVGLGNPGERYAHNRHNIGFMAAAEIAAAFSFGNWQKKFHGRVAAGEILNTSLSPGGGGPNCLASEARLAVWGEGEETRKPPHPASTKLASQAKSAHPSPARGEEKVLLLLPETYMNESGRAVQAAAAFHKIPPENIIVLHDELDLAGGKIRIKQGGGNGGHNGLRSIDAAIGADYWRVRLGIGHPGNKDLVHDYVLSNFSADEKKWRKPFLKSVAEAFPLLLAGQAAGMMNKVSLATKTVIPEASQA